LSEQIRTENGSQWLVEGVGAPSQSSFRLPLGLRPLLISRCILENIGIPIVAQCAVVRDIQRHGISNAF